MPAIVIKTDGTAKFIDPENGYEFSLKELQGYVGGSIERVPRTAPHEVWVNEEGRVHNLPLNPAASNIVGQPLVGDVILFENCKLGDEKHW